MNAFRWKLVLLGMGAVLACAVPGHAGHINTASLFELAGSARALGMGGAFTAVVDDAAAVFYNPAHLPKVQRPALSSLFSCPQGAYTYVNLSAAYPGWGVQLTALDAGPLTERDPYGNPRGTFRYSEAGLILAGGIRFTDTVSLGLQAKLYGRAFPSPAYGGALSPFLSIRDGPWTYALVWQHALSGDLQFACGRNEPWVRNLSLGLSWRNGATVYAVEFPEQLVTRADISSIRLGAESARFDPLVLRAGSHREGTSFGGSFHWGDLRLDLAYVLHYALPDSYYLSLHYRMR